MARPQSGQLPTLVIELIIEACHLTNVRLAIAKASVLQHQAGSILVNVHDRFVLTTLRWSKAGCEPFLPHYGTSEPERANELDPSNKDGTRGLFS